MGRPLVLIHGYSDRGESFFPLRDALKQRGTDVLDVDICTYVSLNNEITIKDIGEGLERAFRNHPVLKDETQEFDAVVHSTGMLVLRSWLTNYHASPDANPRLKRLKHLIGLAPATWGSPQAHKGRTWLGALVKGNKDLGPDFMNAGDCVLDGLELGSRFTWALAHLDLLGPEPYYDHGPNSPYVAVFIGNSHYEGLASVANDPGTDGTVRWAGCALNTRKLIIDLTRTPIGPDGQPAERVTMVPWADSRLDIPMIAVDGRNHATIISNPHPEMVGLIQSFLAVGDTPAFDAWLAQARKFSEQALPKMLVNPAKDGGVSGITETFLGHLFHSAFGETLEGWQQFVVYARDERGDGVTDYMIEVLREAAPGQFEPFAEMCTDVHAYQSNNAYRCFHVRLPKGLCAGDLKLRVRIHASTGTELMTYQGYGTDPKQLTATSEPVEVDVPTSGADTLFFPFTTTLIEVVLNREPLPFTGTSRILKWMPG
jgi:hypothetical protein